MFLLPLLATIAKSDELDTLYARYHEEFVTGTRTPPEAETRGLMNSLRSDGTWADINLTLNEQLYWSPLTHLERIALLAKAYVSPGHPLAGNTELADKTSLALDTWIRKNPTSANWWYNQIGAQLVLGPISYLMWDRLTPSQKKGTDSLLARSWKTGGATGQNLVWISIIAAWRAVLNRDDAALMKVRDTVSSTIVITSSEGIQPDYSFHQHGAQFYSGGYGAFYAYLVPSLAHALRGTHFAFTGPKLDIMAGYLLNGERWIVRGGTLDNSARGRELCRSRAGTFNGTAASDSSTDWNQDPDPNSSLAGSANGLAAAAMYMAPLVPSVSKELTAFGADIKAQAGSSVTGNRWFWRSEYMAHHRKGYSISIRMASQRLLASETVIGEGLLSQYLADGATFFYRTGKEYFDVFPVWDWVHIPGTTVAHTSTPAPMSNKTGNGDFAGGISDGTYGGAAFDYDKLGTKARKAWFFFDREMIALGAGISSTDTPPVHTSINQSLLLGPVSVATGTAAAPVVKDFAPGTALSSPPLWILHDSIGYVFPPQTNPKPSVVSLTSGKQSGNWKRINNTESADNVNKDIFHLWIDHGVKPAAHDYQYVAVMGVNAADLSAYISSPPITILANTANLQAARHQVLGVTQAVFYAAGSLAVAGRYTLSPDRACMVLAQETANGLSLAVSDPRHGTANLIIKANVKMIGQGAVWSEATKTSTITFVLPKGDSAGATTLQAFTSPDVAAIGSTEVDQGMSLSGTQIGAGASAMLSIAYRVPAAGKVRLTLLDPKGHSLAISQPGIVEGGNHSWSQTVTAFGSKILFVRLDWEGRHLVVPIAPNLK